MTSNFMTIPGFPLYEINLESVIRNKKTGQIKKQYIGSTGYFMTTLHGNASKKGKPQRVHRLLASAFIPNPNNLPCINHKDGNKLNNGINNLEWCDHLRNMQHAFKIGLANNTGKRNGMSKLDDTQVRLIKRMLIEGISQYKIARIIGGISRSAVMNIKNRGQWKHVTA